MWVARRVMKSSVVTRLAITFAFCSASAVSAFGQGATDIRQLSQPKQVRVGNTTSSLSKRHLTETAKEAERRLDESIQLEDVDVSVGDLEEFLQSKISDTAVFLDARGLQAASVKPETKIQMTLRPMPLRAALRKMLRPLGLGVVVDDEGLVITADFEELARRGVATDQWSHGSSDTDDAIIRKLDQTVSIKAAEIPLSEAIAGLAEKTEIQMLIDRRSLEEIGLSSEEPVSLQLQGISLRAALRLMLRELDLTYQVKDEVLQITTIEAAEQNLISRIYFLEGLGHRDDGPDSVGKLIMATVVPDTWETLGGPSVIMPLSVERRPSIIVSTTTDVHDQIKALLESLRKAGSKAGPNVDVPSPQQRR